MTFDVDTFVFDARPNYPLLISAKRYRQQYQPIANSSGPVDNRDADDVTLIFAHGTGFHKEQWEPTIEGLWEQASTADPASAANKVAIREAWSVDCANHGDSAVLNEQTLRWGYEDVYNWSDYSLALYLFLKGFGKGVPTDFSTHNLVGIGHSMGAIAVLLTLTHPYPPQFRAIILAEPMLLTSDASRETSDFLVRGAVNRRDIWPSKEEAYRLLSGRKSFQVWDPRVLRIFCEYGLRDLPSAEYPDKQGVTLKCTKSQEAASYRDGNGFVLAYNYLSAACDIVQVHVIYGAINDYIPESMKRAAIEVAAKGRLSSVQRVEGAGHLVVQMQPVGLASAIYRVLKASSAGPTRSSLQQSKL